mmetsp:Transcript_26495/g.30329  ORF Transcript_26495/g.30329 Transcript_26495/m.30329 type:complete len:666 (+) Transcript_26495:130-2127(+)
MPPWDRIEDASSIPAEVWLSKLNDDDDWEPLRKVDCCALNSRKREETVYIDGGRATADVLNGVIRYNFCNLPCLKLTSATWFVREERASKEFVIVPLPREDAEVVESFYQNVVNATSSLGKGVDSIMNHERDLPSDPSNKVILSRSGSGILSMKKKPKSWFGTAYDLQRGYSEYTIDGEEEETTLGPVRHLIFVIHGIGQAFINREGVKIQNLVEEIDSTRKAIQKLQIVRWKKACEKARKAGEPEPVAPNRIEILPIEWWDKIHSSSSSLVGSLKRSTLPNIPGLRAIANDVVFDVLTYMTPTFCEIVLECVTEQLNTIYHHFHNVHPDFRNGGGKYSLIGHSLGSVIVWDLLSILKDRTEVPKQKISKECKNLRTSSFHGIYLLNDREGREKVQYTTGGMKAWGPSLPQMMVKKIPFAPEFTIFLGSPLGMFLTLRGAHSEFDEMLQNSVFRIYKKAAYLAAKEASLIEKNDDKKKKTKEGRKIGNSVELALEVPITSPFTLPSESVYNIFHPYDPVAYRIEPLLLSKSSKTEVPPAMYVTRRGEKVRLHVQAKRFGDDFVKTWQTQSTSINNFFSNITTRQNKDGKTDNTTNHSFSTENLKQGPLEFPLGGRSSRIDYCLQPGVIENEYLSAVTAHSSYFINHDLLHFIIDLTDSSISPKKP